MIKLQYKRDWAVDMRIAVISGASSGIGAEFARELDKAELDEIWLIARNYDGLSKISHNLKTKSKIISVDLSNIDAFNEIKQIYDEIKPEIEYLVCSAGIGFNGPFAELSQNQINLTTSVNCTALSLLISVSTPFLKDGGKIINIASGAGFLPQPNFAVYAASKSYVISLSRALDCELKKNNISVTAVCPGPVDTNFFSSLENVKEYKRKYLISPSRVAIGALKAAKKGKQLYMPTLSMKLVHFISKALPVKFILRFCK